MYSLHRLKAEGIQLAGFNQARRATERSAHGVGNLLANLDKQEMWTEVREKEEGQRDGGREEEEERRREEKRREERGGKITQEMIHHELWRR